MKVAVCGASGGIGQPLSLLLKQSPLITELSLYDIVNTPGVAADLSHINSNAKVKAYNGHDQLPVNFALSSLSKIEARLLLLLTLLCCFAGRTL